MISKKHKSATLGAFTVLLVCGSYVCLLTILQSSFANRVPVAQFECGDGITLRIVADTVWSSERHSAVYYQVMHKGQALFDPYFLGACGLIRGGECVHPGARIAYKELKYTVAFSRDRKVVGVSSTETPYEYFAILDLATMGTWPRDEEIWRINNGTRFWALLDQLYEGDPASSPEKKVADTEYLIRQHTLVLRGPRVNDELISKLPVLPDVEAMDLSFSQVSDRTVRELDRFPSLKRLELSRTRISDEGLKLIFNLKTLKHLDVSGNNITNLDTEVPIFPASIQWVGLWDTPITAKQVADARRRYAGVFFHHRNAN